MATTHFSGPVQVAAGVDVTAGAITADTINEHTSSAGVTVESVKIEDGNLFNAALSLDSTAEMNIMIGGVGALAIDDAAIAGHAAATDTAGLSVYVETQDAGATPTVARAGGALSVKTGDGAAAANAVACGAGGALSLAAGAGGANSGGATGEAGGAGGAVAISGSAGGATNSTGAHAAGAGGSLALTGGVGGAASAGTGDGGAGGSITLTPGAGGATTGGSAGAHGAVNIVSGSASAGRTIRRVGPTSSEGLVTVVQEQTLSPAAVETAMTTAVPAGSVIRAVLANCQAALTGGGTTATWSVGTAGDPDKYGTAGYPSAGDSLLKNGKSSWVGATQVTADETIVLTGAATGGAADGDTALTVGSVRIVVVYDTYDALANAA